MVVKCIETSNSNDPSAILVIEGCIYNVTNIVNSMYREGTNNSIWYQLLETGDLIHHSSCFIEINPDDIFDEKEVELIVENI